MESRAIFLACAAVLCSCCSPLLDNGDRAKLITDLASRDKKIAELTDANAKLNRVVETSQRERDDLRRKVAAFSLPDAEDYNKAYSFNDGIGRLAQEIIGALTRGLNDTTPRTVAVDAITLGGRHRLTNCEKPIFDPAPSKPICETLDQLGRYIEDMLKQGLTNGGSVITVAERGPIIIRGSYLPDSPQTFRILLRIFHSRQDGFSSSFTKTIKKEGISRNYLEFVNQLEDDPDHETK